MKRKSSYHKDQQAQDADAQYSLSNEDSEEAYLLRFFSQRIVKIMIWRQPDNAHMEEFSG